MEQYYQGETIRFDISSTDIDISNNDIIVYIYRKPEMVIKISKNEMSAIDGGYQCVLADSVTKDMKLGLYVMEIRLKATDVIIFKNPCFSILPSVIKKESNENE